MVKAVIEPCTELVRLAGEIVSLARVIVEKRRREVPGEYAPRHLRR